MQRLIYKVMDGYDSVLVWLWSSGFRPLYWVCDYLEFKCWMKELEVEKAKHPDWIATKAPIYDSKNIIP